MSYDSGYAWFYAFLFTQLVEVPIYVFGARTRWDEGFCASAMTHPLVWFVIPRVFGWFYLTVCAPHHTLWLQDNHRYWAMVVVAETFAVGVEGAYLHWLKKPNAYRWSLVANMSSVVLGLTCRSLFGFP